MEFESEITLIPEWKQILPPGVVAADGSTSDPQIVFDEETSLTLRMVPSRRDEFLAGRTCARRVLRKMDIEDRPLLIAADRSPIWPAAITGSISHTNGYCVAAAAKKETFRGIGIDVEKTGAVTGDVETYITSRDELDRIADYIKDPVTKLFCIKEAIYKCIYPTTGMFLEFSEVDVRLSDDTSFTSEILKADCPIKAVDGKFRATDRFTLAFASMTT